MGCHTASFLRKIERHKNIENGLNVKPKRKPKRIPHVNDKTFFYAITIANECYVGQSHNIEQRMKQHKKNCDFIMHKSCKTLYRTIRKNGGWEMVKVTILNAVKCNGLKESQLIEQKYYNACFATLNDMQPTGGSPRRL